jgi:hypothetical protein
MNESSAPVITPFHPPYLKRDIGAQSKILNPKHQILNNIEIQKMDDQNSSGI